MIGVVTDSAASIGSELATAHDVTVVPMLTRLNGSVAARESVAPTRFEHRNGNGRAVSGPTPAAFIAAIDEADQGDGVVVLTVAGRFSATVDSARLAARLSAARAIVVDTGNAAAGEGLVVLAAARAARAGDSLDAVAKISEETSRNVHLVAEVADFRQISRSARLPPLVARVADGIGMHPVFELHDRSLRLLRPALSEQAAIDVMLAAWRRTRPAHAARLHVGTVGVGPVVNGLVEALENDVADLSFFHGVTSPVIAAHVGRGLHGFAWWWEF